MMRRSEANPRPIIFVGPSIPLEAARRALEHADYRPPIRRGDLDDVPPGSVVGIIDGVFAQTLAISPGEIREAIQRGATIYGAASMGALRAAEVREVIGLGRIFEMYRSGTIERDDEVALMFDPDSNVALTEPLVNIRYSVERLVRSGTLDRRAGNALIEAAAGLHYSDRTYRNVLRSSALGSNADVEEIIRLLRNFDLKRDDAQFLLETVASEASGATVAGAPSVQALDEEVGAAQRVREREDPDVELMIWEYGDHLHFEELVRFLKLTGAFQDFARRALSRFALAGTPLSLDVDGGSGQPSDMTGSDAQGLLDSTRAEWGWESPEEAHVTMRDLGIGLEDAAESLEAEVEAERLVAAAARHGAAPFRKALRTELWLHDLSLKRMALRLGALKFFARRGRESGPPTERELSDAKRATCRLGSVTRWEDARARLHGLGVSDPELEVWVHDLAVARRAARPIIEALDQRPAEHQDPNPRSSAWRALGLEVLSSIKPEGTPRFSMRLDEAVEKTAKIAEQIGIVRIGLIGELDSLGVHVAQAFGERSGWSASFSSGKGETREGARVGSIMEEVEIQAQDAFQLEGEVRTSFASAAAGLPMVDPQELDLPYDTRYRDTLEIGWSECFDLVNGRKVLVPSACLTKERVVHDIYYSSRLGAKVFSSSGLGSGFSLPEAIVHAAAEYIERHAMRMAELEIDNPGGVGDRRFWFVDDRTLPPTPSRIVQKFRSAGMRVRILDITSEIAVPTFCARVFEDPFLEERSISNDGFACHPDPEVAVTMALLEAAQTKAGAIAGGREDYSLKARSLGRHERPRTLLRQAQAFWFSDDRPVRSFRDTRGFTSRDILQELEWMVDRVQEAGIDEFLVVDLTMERIRPAHAVRVILPGAETTSPFFTGARARATSIRDVLPRRQIESD